MNVFVVSLFCVWLAVNSCVQTGGLWQLVLCLVSGEQLCTDRRTVVVGVVFV